MMETDRNGSSAMKTENLEPPSSQPRLGELLGQAALDDGTTPAEDTTKEAGKKPVSFFLSLLCLGIVVLIVSWDATSLAVALPVSQRLVPQC